MTIIYNPYNWKIRKDTKAMRDMVSLKENERDAIIDELQNYDRSVNHMSITPIINDLYEIQKEINSMWKDIEESDTSGDLRPTYEFMEYYSD